MSAVFIQLTEYDGHRIGDRRTRVNIEDIVTYVESKRDPQTYVTIRGQGQITVLENPRMIDALISRAIAASRIEEKRGSE